MDRGVALAIATSDGELVYRDNWTPRRENGCDAWSGLGSVRRQPVSLKMREHERKEDWLNASRENRTSRSW